MIAAATMVSPRAPLRWDLFCRVVDNFGDAGVAWRLARELAQEHGLRVTLWIDEPAALARIVPGLATDPPEAALRCATAGGVDVRRWPPIWQDAPAADVVVEMFGAGLPDAYVDAMAAAPHRVEWFVLEYLSAEAWVDASHGLPSPHPRIAVRRRFWFPGFTQATGGLLREHDLLARRDTFSGDSAARAALWRDLGIGNIGADLRVSLFCYPSAPAAALLDAWAAAGEATACLLPEGIGGEAVKAWLAANARRDGATFACRRLTVHAFPFVPQARYDELLWACDFNFVRGEDSFVRAQWAARPFAWHIYPQAENAHEPKLEAFLDRYLEGSAASAANALRGFWLAWNGVAGAPAVPEAWNALRPSLPALRRHATRWARHLETLPELAATLVAAAVIGV